MDGLIVPAVSAGGRIAAAALRRPNLKRRASLKLAVKVEEVGKDPAVSLVLSNSRKNLDTVDVLSIVPMVRIHDQSCGEADFQRVRKGHYGHAPSGAFPVSPGESVTWQVRFRMRDLIELEKQYRCEAMKRTWGDTRYEALIEAEQQSAEFRARQTFGARVARVMHALEETRPVLLLQVSTKHDGQFESRTFRPVSTPLWSQVKAAWA